MKILDRIKNAFYSISIIIDFTENQFLLSIYQNNKLLPYQNLANTDWFQEYFSSAVQATYNHQAVISVAQVQQIYKNRNNLKLAGNINLTITEKAGMLCFEPLLEEPIYFYTYDSQTGYLHKENGSSVHCLEPGFYLQGTTIWHIEDKKVHDLVNKEKIGGMFALDIASGKYPFITCDIKLADRNSSYISGEMVAYQQLVIKYHDKECWEKKSYIKDLTDYCVIKNEIYAEIPNHDTLLNSGQIMLLGAEIPRFVERNKSWIYRFSDEKTKLILDEEIFIKKDELKLVLLCEPEEEAVAAGKTCAVPKLKYQKLLLDPIGISMQMDQDYVLIDKKWGKVSDILAIGIGPMGRLIDGTLMDQVRLKADELIYRGSDRIRGPWEGFLFLKELWYSSGTREEIYMHHLEFLRRYGLNGGAITGELISDPSLFTQYINYLSNTVKTGSILVLLRKKYFDICQEAGGFGNSLIFNKKKVDEGLSKDFHGVIVAFYNDLEKYQCLTEKRWSTLILSEPDIIFKTDRSNLYRSVNSISAHVRIGSLSKDYKTMSEQQRVAILSLLRIYYAYNYELLPYFLRYIGETLTLPKPYPIKVSVKNHMEQSFLIEIEGNTEKGIPIPPRTNNWEYQRTPIIQTWNLDFKETAIKLVNKTAEKVQPVTYISYKPEYENMTAQQLTWYFYWRSEVRKGNYIKSGGDSYVFLYIFELINRVGIKNAVDGYVKFEKIYKLYTQEYPHIKDRISKWLLDYILLNELHLYLPDILPDLNDSRDYLVKNFIIYYKYIQAEGVLEWGTIKELSSYRIEDSRFYQAGYGELLTKHCTEAFLLINNEMKKKYHKTLMQMFCPLKKEKHLYYCYSEAIYYGNSSIDIGMYDFFQHIPLRDFIASVIKYVENKLRIKNSFNGRLKMNLELMWRNLIDESFGDYVQKETNENASAVIRIDTTMLSQLRNESNELRHLLISEDIEEKHNNAQVQLDSAMEENTVTSSKDRESTDLINRIYQKLGEVFIKLLINMQANTWCIAMAEVKPLLSGIMADAYLDQINECCMDMLGNILLFEEDGNWYLEEEYQEQAYAFVKNYEATHKTVQMSETSNVFIDGLSEIHKTFLGKLLEQTSEQKLYDWVMEQGLMTEMLCDEINELFQEEFGDLLIDTMVSPPMIIDEYLDKLELNNKKVGN